MASLDVAKCDQQHEILIDDAVVAHNLKLKRSKIASIIKESSNSQTRTTKFKYLATEDEVQKLKPQRSVGSGLSLGVAEARFRAIGVDQACPNMSKENKSNDENILSKVEDQNYEEECDDGAPEEIIDFMKVNSFSQLNAVRPVDYDSDNDAQLNTKSSRCKSVAPTSTNDIFIGVDKFVDDSMEEDNGKLHYRSVHDDTTEHYKSKDDINLKRQESTIDGRFEYVRGCDSAQVVYRQCIGSCFLPIFSILKLQQSSSKKIKYAIDFEEKLVGKILMMLDYVKNLFNASDADHKLMTESVCDILCDGFLSDDLFIAKKLLTPSCVEDFDIPENRVNSFIRVCQSRMKNIIRALLEKPLLVPERFSNSSEDECRKRLTFEIERLERHVKMLDTSLYYKQLVKPKPKLKAPDIISDELEDEEDHPKSGGCIGCFGETKAAKEARLKAKKERLEVKQQLEEQKLRKLEEEEAKRIAALPPPCLEFDVSTEQCNITHADDIDVVEAKYLLLIKILLQHDNKHMITPETSDRFTYGFVRNSDLFFSESVSADNRLLDKSSERSLKVALASHTNMRKFASENYYEDVKGLHALTKINDLGLEILHNYAIYYGVDEMHESFTHALVYMQSFRGAMSLVMQPQLHRSEHVQCLTNCLHNLYNCVVKTRALKQREMLAIQQHLLINVESIIDDAIRNYLKLFPTVGGNIDDFEDLLRLNVIYYRVQQIVLHLHKKEIDLQRLSHAATVLMWRDIERCLKTRSKDVFQSFKATLIGEKDVYWEYCQKKTFSKIEEWIPFNDHDTRELGLAYVNNDLTKIELQDNVTVDLKTFERCGDDGKRLSKIRGKVNGVEATPLYAVRWGHTYTVILEEETISFSLCNDVYSRKIIVEDIDVFEDGEKKVERKEGVDAKKLSSNFNISTNGDNVKHTGMNIGDHLAFIGEWPTAGMPLGAVYSKLASVTRPVTLRLYSSVNAAQQQENDFEYTYSIILSKQKHDGQKHLGLNLAAPKSWTMSYVMSFSRLKDGSILPAERCNQIRQGDLLMAVNGIDVSKADYDHKDTIKLLAKFDILEMTFKRINVHQSIQKKIKVPALSTYRLQEVIQEVRVTLILDQKYYSQSAEKILTKQIGRKALEDLNSSILKVNALAFYKLIAKEVNNWVSRNEPGPGANHYPDGCIVLYNTLADFETQMSDCVGETWREEYNDDEEGFKPLKLNEIFGQYVVSWIDHTYVVQTTKFIPNMFNIETWEPQLDNMYPITSKSFLVTLNTLIESYQLLPNHVTLSNVIRFGKQDLCELFKFYTKHTKESFKRISLKLSDFRTQKSEYNNINEDEEVITSTNKLCVHINAVYRCWSDFIDILGGLNHIKSVHGFMGMDSSDDDDDNCLEIENGHEALHNASIDGNNWADNLKDECDTKLFTHLVKVHVFSAGRLPKMDYGGLLPADPYIQICVYEEEAIEGNCFETFETRVVNNSQNPSFNESFEFSVVNKNAKVIFRVLDFDHGKLSREIGRAFINLKDYFYNYNEKAGKPQTFKLQPPPASKNHGESNSYGEIKLLIVSRETELGGSTLRYIDKQIDEMICESGWGLIDSHVNTLRELVHDYLYDGKNKYRKLPNKIEDIHYRLVEERIDELIGTMADIINLIHRNLHERNFARALLRIWRVTIDLFIQFLLPTLDRSYPHLKKDSWSSWGFSLGRKNHGDENAKLPGLKSRVKHIDYLDDVQVHMIRLAYDEIFSLLNCDGAKAGLKEQKAIDHLGGDLLKLLEMWKAIDTIPERVMMEVGNIAGKMVMKEEEAMKYGWDGKAGREWRKLNDSKAHFHHLLIYAAYFKRDKQAIDLVESSLFGKDEEDGSITLINHSSSSSFVEGETW